MPLHRTRRVVPERHGFSEGAGCRGRRHPDAPSRSPGAAQRVHRRNGRGIVRCVEAGARRRWRSRSNRRPPCFSFGRGPLPSAPCPGSGRSLVAYARGPARARRGRARGLGDLRMRKACDLGLHTRRCRRRCHADSGDRHPVGVRVRQGRVFPGGSAMDVPEFRGALSVGVGRASRPIDSIAKFCTSAGDVKEGVRAFLDERAPQFSGRASHVAPFWPR